MAITTRSSVAAVKEEITEGTPVAPAAATDYLALQDDFSIAPGTDSLENGELKSSIGKSKPISGAENPTASFSHYLRASGVVAQAPNFGLLLKSCLGAVAVATTEYNTVASSTTSLIKVDTGEGATFQRGEALLIKDGVNGHLIRCLDSISSDDLTPGFKLPAAPAVNVNLGRSVLYYPANTGHSSLTLWHYLGNGGAVQMVSGARCTEASFEMAAGQLITGNYSLEGIGFYYNPITIAAADTKLDFTDDDGTFAATVTAGVYKTPHELASALQTSMRSVSAGETATVSYSDTTGKFTIKTTGTVLSLLWNTGANTANTIGDKIGFLVAADDTGTVATTGYTSDNAISWASPYTASYDSADPLVAKDNEIMIGDTADYLCFEASSVSVAISSSKTNVESVCSTTGVSGSVVNERVVTMNVTGTVAQYDVSKYEKFRTNANTKLQYSFGEKSGGNWVAGKCGAIYVPTATITSFELTDSDGLATIELELSAYVNSSGEGEIFVNFL